MAKVKMVSGQGVKKASVLHVVRPAAGGIRQHVRALLAGLSRHEFLPLVASPAGSSSFDGIQDVKVLDLDIEDKLSPGADVKAMMKLYGFLRRYSPDIVHLHGRKAVLIGIPAAGLGPRPGLVVTVHGFNPYSDGLVGKLCKWAERKSACFADRIVAVSHALEHYLVEEAKIPSSKIRVIPNGVDTARFHPAVNGQSRREQFGFAKDELVVGTVSRLVSGKGTQVLLQAARLVIEQQPKARFLIVGDGPQRTELENTAMRLGIAKRITFTGFREDVPELLAAMEVFAFHSFSEGLGICVLEAMAAGKPIVAAATGGVTECMEEGKHGHLIPAGDPEALARSILDLLEDDEKRRRLGQACRVHVERNYDQARMINKTLEMYLELLRDRQKTLSS